MSRIEEVMPGILRNLTNQIRQMKPMQRTDKMDQAEKITKPLRTQKQHHLNPEKMMTFRNELKDQDKQTPPQTTDPLQPGEVGPNGGLIGLDEAGNKVEWIPDQEAPGGVWPMIILRGEQAIWEAYEEFRYKVWWNELQIRLQKIEKGEEVLTEEERLNLVRAKEAAAELERKYGRENLACDDFEWGLLCGKFSALSWVLGEEWEESFDT